MIPYYVIFFFLVCLCFTDLGVERRQKFVALLLAGFILAVFAGLRPDLFRDYAAYRIYFEELRQGNVSGTVATEPGFLLINRIIGFFTGNHLFLFLTIAFLSVSITLKSFRDYTPFYFIAVLIYFSHTYFGRELVQIRSGLAAALCLYSIRYVIGKQFKLFFLLVLAATSVHLVSILYLAVYPIARSNLRPNILFVLLITCAVIGSVSPLGSLVRKIPYMDILERLQNYNDNAVFGRNLGVFTNPTFVKQFFICIIGLRFYDQLVVKAYGFRVFLISYLIATCWLAIWSDFAILAARVATFFSVTEGLLLASYMYMFEKKSRFIYVFLVIIFAYLMFDVHMHSGTVPPYKIQYL